ncbi:MAG: DUF6159 family protein [Chloroflexi bacterium]|nr:DUF6159 family protein [Chloroflexota bacterium]MCZ6706958.1 DUF6159 family protein [Chloroflexota bacterium]
MGGIFRTFGNTWNITKISASVLRKDKELLLFPIMSGIFVLIVVGIAVAIGASIGTLDRLDAEAALTAGDIVLGVLAIVAAIFVINYFNAALMGAARHRLKGGDPNLRTGFAAVNKHLGAVFGWSVISAIIFILLTYLRGKTDSFIGRMMIGIVGAVWAYMTFFVVPILIVEGVGPIEAIKRSKGYFSRTWGEQLVSGFGFGIIRMIALLPAIIAAAILVPLSPIAAAIVVVPLAAIAFAVVNAMEGIFKMALYEHVAENVQPQFFDRALLEGAYGAGGTQAFRG